MTEVAIRAEGLRKSYGGTLAVDGVDLAIPRGQFFGLLGPNGAGKTSTVHMLSTLIRPTSGEAWVAGFAVRTQQLAVRRNIGVVFQEALLFNRSLADNLRVGKPDATEEEMRIAAGRAQALEFIERSDKKFETHAGERGRVDHRWPHVGGLERLTRINAATGKALVVTDQHDGL